MAAETPGTPPPAGGTPTLAEIARELGRLTEALAARTQGSEAEALQETREALNRLAQQLENRPADEEEARRASRLQKAVLEALRRGGPALFPELAAATLSLPDEIRPVLQEMEREGLVEIRTLRGWQLVSLTDRGRREAGRTYHQPTR